MPVEKQTWTSWVFITYWYSDLVTISTWGASSSILTTGLTATDAILICFVAGICNSVPTVLNGAIGADLHIPFPVAVRASYGYWLSYFCVVSRGILALFWFGIHSTAGGKCMVQILKALWPSFAHIPNTLPAWTGLTTNGMIAYLIYWLIQFPILLIPTHKLQYMFWLKTALVTPMAIAMVVYVAVKAGGSGDFFYAPATVSGPTRAWLWLSSLTSVTGAYSTLAVNIPDFSRFSKSRGAQVWQLPVIPGLKVIIGAFGIIAASAAKKVYGTAYWNPLDIVNEWQGTPGGRAAAFFCAALWLLASVSVNVSANAISFANDITAIAPKYMNIRRGVVFAAFVGGWALCPWIILASASAFLNFMSAYAIFMAPMAGIICCDYWIVKRRRYDVPALYDPAGIYRYGKWKGCNWRALVSTAVTIVPLLPALAQKVAPKNVHIDKGLQNLFSFNWLYGFFLAFSLYWALNVVCPHKETLIPRVVSGYGTSDAVDGVEVDVEGQSLKMDAKDVKDKEAGSGEVAVAPIELESR